VTLTPTAPAWVANTTYASGQQVTNAGNLYSASAAGTCGATGPTHSSGSVVSGAISFNYIAPPTATATISAGGVVDNIGITSQSGLANAPTVTLTGGGGSGAAVTASIPNNHVSTANFTPLAQLTGTIVAGKPTLYALTGGGNTTNNSIVAITDNTARTVAMTSATITNSVLATAGTNYAFRGITFSPGSTISLMPIELSEFNAKANATTTLLTWTTASEKDNALFNIERSTNGTDFQTIGQVKGSGTSNVAKDYVFEDKTPAQGVNYYRLQQVDFNGKSSRSMVRSVVFGNTELVVKPTLVQDELQIVVGDESPTTLQIFNIAGQRVLTAQAQGEQRINISSLPAGAYFIQTATGTTRRFVKQ
jgi:Secretion system C-terminal sorting domain